MLILTKIPEITRQHKPCETDYSNQKLSLSRIWLLLACTNNGMSLSRTSKDIFVADGKHFTTDVMSQGQAKG